MKKSKNNIADFVNAATHLEVDEFSSSTLELAEDLKYVFSLGDPSRGKSELIFECGKAFNINRQTLLPFAMAAELMMASAMNDDDIIDGNELRYGEKPLYLLKGVPAAMMVSGYMYGLLFSILKKYRPATTSEFFAGYLKAENLLVEYFRLMHDGQYSTTREVNFQSYGLCDLHNLAFKKAGLLYQFCLSVPAYLAGIDAAELEEFGCKLGIAIQFQSDIRDFIKNPDDPDKPDLRFEDYLTGQPNLVMLIAKEHLRGAEKTWLIESWSRKKEKNCNKMVALIEKSNATKTSIAYLQEKQVELKKIIGQFSKYGSLYNFFRNLLKNLC